MPLEPFVVSRNSNIYNSSQLLCDYWHIINVPLVSKGSLFSYSASFMYWTSFPYIPLQSIWNLFFLAFKFFTVFSDYLGKTVFWPAARTFNTSRIFRCFDDTSVKFLFSNSHSVFTFTARQHVRAPKKMLCVCTEPLYPKGMCGRPAIFKTNFCNHLDQEKSLVFMEKSTAIQDVTRAKVDEPSDDRLDCGKNHWILLNQVITLLRHIVNTFSSFRENDFTYIWAERENLRFMKKKGKRNPQLPTKSPKQSHTF